MAKAKWGVASKQRRKRLLKQAKGYTGDRRLRIRKVKETVMRALVYSTRDRKNRKREFRNLWVIRLNAAARAHGLTYSQFISACRKANIGLDRKQLAELAINDQPAFESILAQVTVRN